MPRNISFMLTTEQIKNKTKTVTRRNGWLKLKAGDVLNACEKCMGLKKGEKVVKLGQIKVTSVSREPLSVIDKEECIAEGFPEMEPEDFISMFVKTHKGTSGQTEVTRIEFVYLPQQES